LDLDAEHRMALQSEATTFLQLDAVSVNSDLGKHRPLGR
jgi:hypothetical protein